MNVLDAVHDIYDLTSEAEAGDVPALTADSGSRWSVARVLKWINRISKEVAEDTLCLWETSLESAVEDQAEYAMASDWGQIISVRFNDKPLKPTAIQRLDHWERNGGPSPWRDKSTVTPTHWYSGEQSGYYGLFQKPNADGTDVIEAMHTVIPTEFTTASAPSTELLNAKAWLKPYHRLIVYGVLEICFASDKDLEMAAYYNSKYTQGKTELMMKVKRVLDPIVSFEYDRAAVGSEFLWSWVEL